MGSGFTEVVFALVLANLIVCALAERAASRNREILAQALKDAQLLAGRTLADMAMLKGIPPHQASEEFAPTGVRYSAISKVNAAVDMDRVAMERAMIQRLQDAVSVFEKRGGEADLLQAQKCKQQIAAIEERLESLARSGSE